MLEELSTEHLGVLHVKILLLYWLALRELVPNFEHMHYIWMVALEGKVKKNYPMQHKEIEVPHSERKLNSMHKLRVSYHYTFFNSWNKSCWMRAKCEPINSYIKYKVRRIIITETHKITQKQQQKKKTLTSFRKFSDAKLRTRWFWLELPSNKTSMACEMTCEVLGLQKKICRSIITIQFHCTVLHVYLQVFTPYTYVLVNRRRNSFYKFTKQWTDFSIVDSLATIMHKNWHM